MAFLLKAMGFGGAIPGFPFTVDAKDKGTVLDSALVPWTMKLGKGDEDDRPVTIFSVSLAACSSAEAKGFARNALALSKRLRLPGVLRCYGGTEYGDTIHLAMEPCEPLAHVLADPARWMAYYGEEGESSDNTGGDDGGRGSSGGGAPSSRRLFEAGVAMGVKSVGGGALAALHKNDLFHGNVCADSVFVVEGGLWRLWGLELTSPCAAGGAFTHVAQRLLPPCRAPRQLLEQLSGGSANADPRIVDSYGLGCLLYESLVLTQGSAPHGFDGRRSLQLQDVRQGKSLLPKALWASFDPLTDPSPQRQSTVEAFMLRCGFIKDCDYVRFTEEMDEFALWDLPRREAFLERLVKAVPSFPPKPCLTVFLPKLVDSVRMGTATASVVAPVLAIARRVTNADFDAWVTPALVVLYSSQDRLIRYRLLQSIDLYGSRIAAKPLNEQLWPLFVKGFVSPAANVREYTARALVPLAPRLSAYIMANDVPRMLQTLQQDPDGTIRANATICLCLVADRIPEENDQRAKLLVFCFGRMLKDSCLPSRTAALKSFGATLHLIPAKLLASMVVPSVAPVTVDVEAEARQAALGILKRCMASLEAYHESAPVAPSPAAEPAAPPSQAQGPREGSHKHSDPAATAPLAPVKHTPTATPPPLVASSGWDDDDDDGWSAAPSATKTASTAPPHAPAPAPAPEKGPTDGWEDDDDGEGGGWGVAPVSRPTIAPRTNSIGHPTGAPSPGAPAMGVASGGTSQPRGAAGTAMKLTGRKKAGSLGASRLE